MRISHLHERREFMEVLSVTATCYQPFATQCDESPLETADGSHIDPNNPLKHRWVAISRDLKGKYLQFNDTIIVQGAGKYNGRWIVKDVMNKRFKRTIDLLVGKNDDIGKWENATIQIKN